MDNEPVSGQSQPHKLPFYTGRNMNDAIAYMEEVMQVFRQRRVFNGFQSFSQPNSQLRPYHQSNSQNSNQQLPLIDRLRAPQNIQQNYQNAQISERVRRAQELNEICLQDARNHALAKIGLSSNTSNEQNKPQSPTQQSIQQNQANIENYQNPLQTSQNTSTDKQIIQTPLINNQTQTKIILGYQNQQTSLFANQTSGISSVLGYQNQGTTSLFGNKNQGITSFSGGQNLGATSLFGSQHQGTSPLFGNQNTFSSLGYQNKETSPLFANQKQENSSVLGYQTQEKSLFGNQNSTTSSVLGYQEEGKQSLFGNKTQQNTNTLGKEKLKEQNVSENISQTPSFFGYKKQQILERAKQKTQETQNNVNRKELSTINEEKSESSANINQSIMSSIPQNTGNLFGSLNKQNQPSVSISGGLFSNNAPPKEATLGYSSTNTIFSQPTQNAKPFTLGYQTPFAVQNQDIKKQQVKTHIKNEQTYKEEEKPVRQINFFNTQKQPVKPNNLLTNSQNHPGETIFTQKPTPNSLFSNTQPVVATKQPQPEKNANNMFNTSQPIFTTKQAQQKPKPVNIFGIINPVNQSGNFFGTSNQVSQSGNPQQQPKVKNIFASSQPLIKQTKINDQGTLNHFSNAAQKKEEQSKKPDNIFKTENRITQQTKPNIFRFQSQTPQQAPTTNLFGNLSNNNMFGQPINNNSSPFGTLNTSGQNMFGSASQGSSTLFGGQRPAITLFNQVEKKKDQQEEGSGEEGSDGQDDEDNNQQESKEESNQGQIKYKGYNQTDIIYKLEEFAPKLKVVSTGSLRQNVKLSLERFPQNDTIYIIVRMSNKNPIYYGMLTKYSNVKIFNQENSNFSMKLEKLVHINAMDNKRSMESWRIQVKDTKSGRGFFAKCQQIVKNLKETQK